MADSKKYNGSTWENAVVRKYGTASEIITPPTTIYSDGTAITAYTIKGNTVQNGTPSPSNPVDVVGVGTLDSGQYKIPISSGGVTTNIYLGSTQTTRQIKKYVMTGNETITSVTQITAGYRFRVAVPMTDMSQDNRLMSLCTHFQCVSDWTELGFTPSLNGAELFFMVSDISTSAAFTAYLQQQYANGTPVTVWYVLATATTGQVNEPLMKIGNYADTLSNATAIPTTEGANSITVDTTVQPSEFTATWTGWHDASVKEWDGSQWN